MQNMKWRIALVISVIAVGMLVLAACSNSNSAAESAMAAESADVSDTHDEEEDADEHDDATGSDGEGHDDPVDAAHDDDDADDGHEDVSADTEGGPHTEDEEGHEDMAEAHGIPTEEAARENPVPFNDASIARGAELYQTSCAVCHGDQGLGDGAAGVALDPKPANLTEDHVQENTDGSLFYTISNGVEGTAMVAWQGQFSEEDRWNMVNFIRSLPESE